MENNVQSIVNEEEDSFFSFKDFLLTCLAQWKWFVISVIFFAGVAMLYIMRQQPVYTRTMSVLIQDNDNGGALDVSGAFKTLGLGGNNTNVFNEMVSLKSPAVMTEVVSRLNLNISVNKKGLLHNTTLYGKSSPLEVIYPDLPEKVYCQFNMELSPDDSYELSGFIVLQPDGSMLKDKEKVVKGKLGFEPIKTPAGTLIFRPNGSYTNTRTEPITIKIGVKSIHSTVESYVAKLKVDLSDSDADVIDLSINDVNIQRATDVLNMVVEVYNEFWVRDKNRMAVATSEFIDDRLNSLVKELSEVDTDIADYQSQNLITDLDQTSKMFTEQSSAVNREILEINNHLAMAKYIRDYIANPSNENSVVPVNTGMGSTVLEQMIKEYNTLLLNRNNLAANSGLDNPIVRDYDNQVKGVRSSLMKSVNAQVGSLQANLKSLEAAQANNDGQIANAPNKAKFLGSIKRDQAVKESLYLFLLEKREDNNLTKAFNAYNTRIITPPFGPNQPISPRKGVTMLMAIVFGLFLPAAILYFVIVCDSKIHSRRDLENLPIPFTGEIPQVGRRHRIKSLLKTKKKRQKEIDTPKPIVGEGKRDVPNEAFRVVRSNIDLMINRTDDEHPVLMVTSFNPGSGKSFVAFNLGASFALKRKKVLLIDGDLRHGSLSSYVGNPHRGLAAFLTEKENNPAKIIYPVNEIKGLSVIPIGKRPPNPAELLERERFGELLDAVKQDFDIILVDCPPVNVVVDTQLLNRYADATIFVVRAGLLEKSAVRDLVTLYNEKKLKRMSLLLNGTEAAHSSYYTYGNYQSLEE